MKDQQGILFFESISNDGSITKAMDLSAAPHYVPGFGLGKAL